MRSSEQPFRSIEMNCWLTITNGRRWRRTSGRCRRRSSWISYLRKRSNDYVASSARLELEIEAASKHAGTVRAALDRIGAVEPGETPILVAYRIASVGQPATLTPTLIPVAGIEALEMIAAGDLEPGSMIQRRMLLSPWPASPVNKDEPL